MQILPTTQPAPIRLINPDETAIVKRATDSILDDAADPGSGIIAPEIIIKWATDSCLDILADSEQVYRDTVSSLAEYRFENSARRFILTNHYSDTPLKSGKFSVASD